MSRSPKPMGCCYPIHESVSQVQPGRQLQTWHPARSLTPKEGQTPLVLPYKPTGTWLPYVLHSPEGLLMVPSLSPSSNPDMTAFKPCRKFFPHTPPPQLDPTAQGLGRQVGGVSSVESAPRWLCGLCGQLHILWEALRGMEVPALQ